MRRTAENHGVHATQEGLAGEGAHEPSSAGRLHDTPALHRRLAQAAFLAYMFFIFFGTALPFQERLGSAGDISSSNSFTQAVFSTIFLLAGIALLPRLDVLAAMVKREKFLTLFLLWCGASILWSDFAFTSFKRWIQVCGCFLVCSAFLAHASADEALGYLKKILALYLPLSLLSVVLIPGAIQWEFPAWRGLAPSKNWLGQISLMSALIWSTFRYEPSPRGRFFSGIFFGMSLLLLAGARSSTALLVGFALVNMALLFAIENRLAILGIGRAFSIVTAAAVLLFMLAAAHLGLDALAAVSGIFGKDTTFSERSFLWQEIFAQAQRRPLTGWGFDGFWVPGNAALDELYRKFIWLPNQAHMGYLDILNEIGIIGLALLAALVAAYFVRLAQLSQPHFWKWFVIAPLLFNFQESTLFRLNTVTGVLFTFAYLALHREWLDEETQRHGAGAAFTAEVPAWREHEQ